MVRSSDHDAAAQSTMIANPSLPAYRYNPYDKTLTHEVYDYDLMTTIRRYGVTVVGKMKRAAVPATTTSRSCVYRAELSRRLRGAFGGTALQS